MAAFIRQLIAGYKYIIEDAADPRTQDYFLIGSPWPCIALLGFYICFIYYIGPRFMAKRQPFQLDRILQIYNLSQIIINAILLYKVLTLAWLRDYSFFCQPIDYSYSPKAIEIARGIWSYFMLKILDLLETVFFVLRKKQNQVSFLHVYHHVGMLLGTWIATKYIPGGHVTFLGLVNTFVHVIMYIHYLLSSMKIDTGSWKKYITQLQLIQFFLIILHYGQLAWEDCGFPVWPAYIMIPQNVFMIILFGDFYYKMYIKKRPTIKMVPREMETNGISANVSKKKSKEQ
ncbi:elongation of very long chain fatty acids protein-like [Cataglyphis hispanica]|uniref:elongation of very long chain fatty acids protein-like n=1 Tax=Cataglyphis hispanica TaxID=1086592 RepID=UPI00217FD486|nr:elongation of very long chain fatty acids protein-like [Cataglyphis hispanica]